MANILVIDFDIIMYPCIKLYDKLVWENENPTVIWDNLEHMIEIDKFLSYDANILKQIIRLIKANNSADLIPINNSSDMIELLGDDVVNANITHIGWHSGYTDDDNILHEFIFGKYTNNSWINYAIYKGATAIRWIRASNSEVPKNMDGVSVSDIKYIDGIDNNFDCIYISLSPQYVPFKYKHLYDIIIEIFSKG